MFQIIYEHFFNDDNEAIETGNIIYANLILQGKEYPLYFFKSDQVTDYFDERGQSYKKNFNEDSYKRGKTILKFW